MNIQIVTLIKIEQAADLTTTAYFSDGSQLSINLDTAAFLIGQYLV